MAEFLELNSEAQLYHRCAWDWSVRLFNLCV